MRRARRATTDTREALKAIRPLAKELRIDVEADGHFLYCDGQPIGIACNSTYATIKEFIGYVILRSIDRDILEHRKCGLTGAQKDAIRMYWTSQEQAAKIRKHYAEYYEGRFCRDCAYLNTADRTSTGCLCERPPKGGWRTRVSMYKQPSTRCCPRFRAKEDET